MTLVRAFSHALFAFHFLLVTQTHLSHPFPLLCLNTIVISLALTFSLFSAFSLLSILLVASDP